MMTRRPVRRGTRFVMPSPGVESPVLSAVELMEEDGEGEMEEEQRQSQLLLSASSLSGPDSQSGQ